MGPSPLPSHQDPALAAAVPRCLGGPRRGHDLQEDEHEGEGVDYQPPQRDSRGG